MTGNNKFEMETADSTQSVLNEMLMKQDVPEGTVVLAHEQTSGKGMAGNSWHSEKGMNLTFSFVWYPLFLRADHQFRMNKAIALAVHDFVESEIQSPPVTIKWPNDIFIGDKKVAGILIENCIMDRRFKHSIIGIGVNINQEKFSEMTVSPASMKIAGGRALDIHMCLDQICMFLDARYEQLKNDIRTIDSDYEKNLYRYNIFAAYHYKGCDIRARITGINPFGHLMLVQDNGQLLTCDLKEIVFLQES